MDFWSFVTGEDLESAKAQSDAADRQLAELNRKKLENGSWDLQTYQTAQAQLDASALTDPQNEVKEAFKEGFEEGVDNVRGSIGDILALPFRLIPPIGWLLIGVGLFFYFGGGVLVRKKVTSA